MLLYVSYLNFVVISVVVDVDSAMLFYCFFNFVAVMM